MKSDWYKKYWEIGFATRLYDLLAPQAYIDCFQRGVEFIPPDTKIILDAGCGSGLLLTFLKGQIKSGCRYVGTDKLWIGVSATAGKFATTGEGGGLIVQSDLLEGLALKENSIDIVFAFFLVYTAGDSEKRRKLIRNLRYILKPGGKLILVNPSRNYSARNIIRVSLEEIKKRDGLISWFIKKYFVYPLTLGLGLNHVESQLKSGAWQAYSELEIKEGGFQAAHIETIYADSAYLVVAE